MERQAVCPTCRRSVMLGDRPPAAQANRGDAVVLRLGLNMGGNNNQNQPAPAAGADGAGIPGAPGFQNNAQQPPAGANNLRMINLGPLRIGFAQGGAGEMQNMIDRMQAPAGQVDGNAAAPMAPQPQAATAAGATGAEAIANQLREVETRIQREFAALNVSQQEATTLRLLLLELQRLRDQANVVNGTAPVEPQLHPNGLPVYPPQLHQFPPTFAPFIPPRMHSPSVMRLGADPNAGAIPAGSADLPEGVTIPQGWSLLPLQRLDANAPVGAASPSGSAPPNTQVGATGALPSPAEQPQNQGAPAQESAASSSSSAPALPPRDLTTVPIEQPQPVAPNWGGAAQFFRNNSTPTPQATASGSDVPPQAPSAATNGSAGEGSSRQAAEETNGTNGSASRDKPRAVTVEEAGDDDAE